MVIGEFIRVDGLIDSTPYGKCLHLAEVKAYDPSGQELTAVSATGGPTYVQPGTTTTWTADKAIDGDNQTYYHSKCEAEAWLQVDFGDNLIGRVAVVNRLVGPDTAQGSANRIIGAEMKVCRGSTLIFSSRFQSGADGNAKNVYDFSVRTSPPTESPSLGIAICLHHSTVQEGDILLHHINVVG